MVVTRRTTTSTSSSLPQDPMMANPDVRVPPTTLCRPEQIHQKHLEQKILSTRNSLHGAQLGLFPNFMQEKYDQELANQLLANLMWTWERILSWPGHPDRRTARCPSSTWTNLSLAEDGHILPNRIYSMNSQSLAPVDPPNRRPGESGQFGRPMESNQPRTGQPYPTAQLRVSRPKPAT
uniref:Uncharacterized protein n=1 Tax=Cannabis sativa TaxID=3483 RepID=A0A803QK20_CANSA